MPPVAARCSVFGRRVRRYRVWVPATLIATIVTASPAAATVLELDDTGAVTVHAGPETRLDPAAPARPILRPPAAADHRSAPGVWSPAPSSLPIPTPVRATIAREARREALSPHLVEAVGWVESRLNSRARSPKGALGVMQLMPATARSLGVDPGDPDDNIRGGTAYLAQLLQRYDGDIVKALAAYNASPKAVDRYGGLPPYRETTGYVAAILDRLAQTSLAAPQRP